MAIDFLIFGFLLLSFTINLLPLGAFWVTPGLRTTANRFVINLLIINLIGCCILAPTLYLNGHNMLATVQITDDESFENIAKGIATHQKTQQIIRDDVSVRNGSELVEMMTLQCKNSTTKHCEQQQLTIIEERGEKIVITELNESKLNNMLKFSQNPRLLERTSLTRCWSIDLAAALGALSVLLVVGDTWMAVRDPLRYHSRISGVKSWSLIAVTWILGILFGVMSALREINFQYNAVIEKKRYSLLTFGEQMEISNSTNSTIFSMIFACIYFIVIILLPFGFVCGMYWRIFSEAKENGLRMRQNGSSPLLQSATNLSHHHSHHHHHHHHHEHQRNAHHLLMQRNSITSRSAYGGLQFQIDRKRNHRDSTIKIAEVKKTTPVMESSVLPPLAEPEESLTEEGNGNVIPMALPSDCVSDSGDIKRNYSVRQFPALRKSSQDIIDGNRLNTFRQIKSTPNLQKHGHRDSLNGLETTFHLQNMPANRATSASPKSLSYMTSIRRRLSNASSLFKQREESRAARISILVVIMFLVSYLPYGLLVLLQDRLIDNFPHSTQLAVFMILLANFSSPFIFAYRNKNVRHGVTRLFGLDARSKEHRLQCNGIFLRYGTKARISVKRSSSKVSAYSMNSCKYLTPILRHTNKSLRSTNNGEQKNEANTFLTSAQVENSANNQTSNKSENIDVVDTTITIQPDDPHEKFSIFKVFRKNSRSANCSKQSSTAESMEI